MRDDHEDSLPTEPPSEPPPTSRQLKPPPPYSGEPAPGVLSEIHRILTSPNGALTELRRDVNGLINVVQRRQAADEANWSFFKSELSATRSDVRRIEAKLDRIDARVTELERQLAAQHARIDAIEARLAEPSPAPTT